MLAYTVPIDMHPSKGEMLKNEQNPQKPKIKATEIMSRLSVERLFCIIILMIRPKTPPSSIIPRFCANGTAISETFIALPAVDATASEIATLYANSPTRSSSATTCNRVLTKSPRAPVCLIVMSVDAGAVAAASAPSTAENARLRSNTKYMTQNTAAQATHDSATVITTTFNPF